MTPGEHLERAPLSRAAVVDAALSIVDEQGVAALSVRKVASRLGYEPMALYRHVTSRDDLFDAVVDRVVDELDDDPDARLAPTDGWRDWLAGLARGVRRYGLAHPHAFPLVATRPPSAPWVNPPLRSLRWIEALLAGLRREGFSDDEVLFVYRSFNGFLLGFLLLETSAATLADPKAGDGALGASGPESGGDVADAAAAVPGALSPVRSPADRRAVARADTPEDLVDPLGAVPEQEYPTVHDLAEGLAEDRWADEFDAALDELLGRIERYRGRSG